MRKEDVSTCFLTPLATLLSVFPMTYRSFEKNGDNQSELEWQRSNNKIYRNYLRQEIFEYMYLDTDVNGMELFGYWIRYGKNDVS